MFYKIIKNVHTFKQISSPISKCIPEILCLSRFLPQNHFIYLSDLYSTLLPLNSGLNMEIILSRTAPVIYSRFLIMPQDLKLVLPCLSTLPSILSSLAPIEDTDWAYFRFFLHGRVLKTLEFKMKIGKDKREKVKLQLRSVSAAMYCPLVQKVMIHARRGCWHIYIYIYGF